LFYKIEATVPDLDFCVSFERDLYRAVLPEKRIEFKDEPRQIFSVQTRSGTKYFVWQVKLKAKSRESFGYRDNTGKQELQRGHYGRSGNNWQVNINDAYLTDPTIYLSEKKKRNSREKRDLEKSFW
jgi:hypothetical protein